MIKRKGGGTGEKTYGKGRGFKGKREMEMDNLRGNGEELKRKGKWLREKEEGRIGEEGKGTEE